MYIEVEKIRNIRILWMDNPPENRFNQVFLDEFNGALDQIENDDSADAMIFSGRSEKYFCNGIDIPWALAQDYDGALKFLLTYIHLVHRLLLYPKPVIAAINGHAFAGGFFLSMCADWRVMREDKGFMCIPEIDLPFDLPLGHVALTSSVIGQRNTDYISLSGDKLDARTALKIGAIDEASTADELIGKAISMAQKFGKKNAVQFQRHKTNLRERPAKVLLAKDLDFMRDLVEKLKGKDKR